MTRPRNSAWYQRHVNDPFVKQAQQQGKRSRAAFKFSEIAANHKLVGSGDVVVDLGSTPGSWSQELARMVGVYGTVIAVDVLPMAGINGVKFIQGDVLDVATQQQLIAALSGRQADLVVSDMAPEISGNKIVDQARTLGLNEMTLEFARRYLKPNGALLLKTFMGQGSDLFRRELQTSFASVRNIKPAASRNCSSEFYWLATGRKIAQPS